MIWELVESIWEKMSNLEINRQQKIIRVETKQK
jgi:hypothetical protein